MTEISSNFLSKTDTFLAKQEKLILFFILLISSAFALFLFDTKLSDGHDDSLYIMSGIKYAKNFFGYFHTANAPLYTMFLAFPIKIWGANLIVLKLFSTLFFILSIFILFKTFRKRIPYSILFSVLFTIGLNQQFLFFAHQTFTEAFFFFIQSIFFYVLFKHIDFINTNKNNIKTTWKRWLLLGFMVFILSITKSITIAALGAIIIFFFFRKEFLNIVYLIVPSVFFIGLFSLLKKVVWNAKGQFASQGNRIFVKNYYDKSQGTEDLYGMIQRLFDNYESYISKHLFSILGLKDFNSESTFFWGILALLLLGLAFFWAYKNKNDYIKMVGFYVITLCTAFMLALQTHWMQARFILVYIPFILILFYYGIYSIIKIKLTQILAPIFIILLITMPYLNFKNSWALAPNNTVKLRKNLKGDVLYGLTNDWKHYIQMSKWIGENLSDSDYVACRKPPKSFIYSGGKNFHGIYNVPTQDADTLLMKLKDNHVTHIMLANLRINPQQNTGQTITTVRRYMVYIQQKYPNTFTLVHQIGQEGQEPTQLFKITYPKNNVKNKHKR